MDSRNPHRITPRFIPTVDDFRSCFGGNATIRMFPALRIKLFLSFACWDTFHLDRTPTINESSA
jgi:hypothetical protein